MQKDSGFSLAELLTVIAILAILAAIAIPGLIGWRSKAQLGRAARDVYSNFQKAKIEAARRNTPCTITFSANDYVVYTDINADWAYQAGEEIVGPIPWSNYPGVSLDTAEGGGDGLSFANPGNGIAFTPNGFTQDNTGTLAGGTVYLSSQGNKKTRIVLSPAGSVRIN
jgi:prepilin-type N-terminal cleavage/methylation domain-containing protein